MRRAGNIRALGAIRARIRSIEMKRAGDNTQREVKRPEPVTRGQGGKGELGVESYETDYDEDQYCKIN